MRQEWGGKPVLSASEGSDAMVTNEPSATGAEGEEGVQAMVETREVEERDERIAELEAKIMR
jgi:hypothetical protein